MPDDRSFHTEFLRPLHARPLVQCQCGQWFSQARCCCRYPEAPHAPEQIAVACRVCTPDADESRETVVFECPR